MQKDSKKHKTPTDANNVLDDVFLLVNPEKYKGFCNHPITDNTLRQVEKSIIKPCVLNGKQYGYSIEIFFADDKRFFSTSDSIRGAKQQFAFQCKSGSKWVNQNII